MDSDELDSIAGLAFVTIARAAAAGAPSAEIDRQHHRMCALVWWRGVGRRSTRRATLGLIRSTRQAARP